MMNDGKDLHCSGSVISTKFIITAAHCMIIEGKVIEDKTLFQIILGADDLQEKKIYRTKLVKKYQIRNFWLHDQYDHLRRTIDYDISIIEVTPEIKFEVIFIFSSHCHFEH